MALTRTNWTWDAAHRATGTGASDSVLSNASGGGYLTVTRNHATVGNVNLPGRSVEFLTMSVGDWIEVYAKVDGLGGSDGVGLGFMNPDSVMDSNGLGNGADSCGLYGDGSTAYGGVAATSLGASFAVNDIMGCKLELTGASTLVWSVNKNGGSWVVAKSNANAIRSNSNGNIHACYTTYFNTDAMTLQVIGGGSPGADISEFLLTGVGS